MLIYRPYKNIDDWLDNEGTDGAVLSAIRHYGVKELFLRLESFSDTDQEYESRFYEKFYQVFKDHKDLLVKIENAIKTVADERCNWTDINPDIRKGEFLLFVLSVKLSEIIPAEQERIKFLEKFFLEMPSDIIWTLIDNPAKGEVLEWVNIRERYFAPWELKCNI